ncbi:MAG: MFS transporter [Sedimentisphaerales bacterium]|nr:MFS transporter [Sedimentisphaerales bacterium]
MNKPLHSQVKMSAGLMVLAFTAYISLGLPDGLLGVSWPSMRHDFSLNHDSFGALMIAFTAGYLTSSFFGGRLMAHFKLGTLLTASTFSAAIALLGYSVAPFWWLIVIAAVAAGLGGGGIDVTLNNYVASNHGDALMQWLHASYGIGATAGPVIMTTAITLTGSWRSGYLLVGLLQLALMLSFLLTIPMWENSNKSSATSQKTNHLNSHDTSMRNTLRHPKVWLSIFLFFIYMGVEVAFGAWAYTLLTESREVSTKLAGYWVGSFWGIFTIGRIVAGIYTSRIRRMKLIMGSFTTALVATVILALDINNIASLAAIIVIGLAIAPVLPALISGTADRVGARFAANTIGIQIAAMGIGGATIPSICGVIAKRFSLEAIPVFMIILIIILIFSYTYSVKAVKTVSY